MVRRIANQSHCGVERLKQHNTPELGVGGWKVGGVSRQLTSANGNGNGDVDDCNQPTRRATVNRIIYLLILFDVAFSNIDFVWCFCVAIKLNILTFDINHFQVTNIFKIDMIYVELDFYTIS